MMDDPEDEKPEGYDQPKQIADPEAKQPEEWDEEEDGEWDAPMIDNPEFKGTWKAKRIENPAYIGEWKAKQVANPDFVENVYGFDDIGSVGFELWTVNAGSIFDNIVVTDSLEEAWKHADEHWEKIKEGEKEAQEAFDKANAPPPAEPDADGEEELDDEEGGADDEDEM